MIKFNLTKDYEEFYQALKKGKDANKYGCYVALKQPEYYKQTKNFLMPNLGGGFSIKDGDLISVFKNPEICRNEKIDNIFHDLMYNAYANGAKKLDCYGEFLAISYMHYGFLPVCKVKFDLKYNPDWPVETEGEPDVIIMMKGISSIGELERLQTNNSFVNWEDISKHISYFNDYDKAIEYRDNLLKNSQKFNYNYADNLQMIIKENEKVNKYVK